MRYFTSYLKNVILLRNSHYLQCVPPTLAVSAVLCVRVCVCVCVCVCSRDLESSETHAPNTLSALANKAFKVIVSCLTV